MQVAPQKSEGIQEDVWIPTACDMCYNACSVKVHKVNGVAIKVEGLPGAPPNYGVICAKGNAGIMNLYNPYRVLKPKIRTNSEKGIGIDPKWRDASWDECLAIITEKLKKIRDDDPRKLIVATFDTYSFGPLTPFLTAFGSPNWTTGPAGYFCGNGVHPVSYTMTGAIDVHPDLQYSNYCVHFGNQFGFVGNSNAMPITTEMARARIRGLKLVVVDPVLSYAASQADEWIPIKPGTDTALALGAINLLINEYKIYDAEYLKKWTNAPYLIGPDGRYARQSQSGKPVIWDPVDKKTKTYNDPTIKDYALEGEHIVNNVKTRPAFEILKDHVRKYSPEHVSELTTIPVETIRRFAKEFGEQARIGSTIEIDGKSLPWRPAVATWYRGVVAHKHAMHNGLAIALLNAVVGAIDVPGGLLNANAAGPFGFPTDGVDGMLEPGNSYSHMRKPLPPQKVKPPETLELVELFPVAVYARAMLWLGILYPEKFKIPYSPEALIVCRTNLLHNTADPQIMGEAMKKIPFIVHMADHLNETSEFADIILPDTHYLERLVPLAMNPYVHFRAVPLPGQDWAFNLQQPVVKAVGEARNWIEVMYDIAERIGILPDLYNILNASANFEDPHKLDPAKKYTWEEICDRWQKSWFGKEHGLDYFKSKGYHTIGKRTVEELYPRAFHKGRIPIYFEHFLNAGEDVREVTQKLGITDWDTSDYSALLDWKPCPSHLETDPEYDLWAVNHKLPFHTFSFSSENSYLSELCEKNAKVYNIAMNPETAKRKGIKDGDSVWIGASSGRKERGTARITEGIHPQVVSIPGVFGRRITGNPEARGKGTHFNSLIEYTFDRMDTVSAALDACVKVKVTRD